MSKMPHEFGDGLWCIHCGEVSFGQQNAEDECTPRLRSELDRLTSDRLATIRRDEGITRKERMLGIQLLSEAALIQFRGGFASWRTILSVTFMGGNVRLVLAFHVPSRTQPPSHPSHIWTSIVRSVPLAEFEGGVPEALHRHVRGMMLEFATHEVDESLWVGDTQLSDPHTPKTIHIEITPEVNDDDQH